MTPEAVQDAIQQGLEVTVLIILVLLLPALLAGLIVSMLQAATGIQEMTLSFIPKLLVTFLALVAGGSWMIGLITDYTRRLFESIPYLIG